MPQTSLPIRILLLRRLTPKPVFRSATTSSTAPQHPHLFAPTGDRELWIRKDTRTECRSLVRGKEYARVSGLGSAKVACVALVFASLHKTSSHVFHESHSEGASAGVFELAVAIRYDDADTYGPIGLEIYFRLDTHQGGCPMSTLTPPPWRKQVGYEEKKLIQAYLTLSCLTFVISEVGGCHAILAEKDGRYAMQCTRFFNVEIDRAGTRFLPTSHIVL